MSKREIDIEDLPEGYELGTPRVVYSHMSEMYPEYINIPLKKIQPRRIVLEETGEERVINKGEWFMSTHGDLVKWGSNLPTQSVHYLWREVKGTELSDPKLSLSEDECKAIYRWMDATGFKFHKIANFIKAKS